MHILLGLITLATAFAWAVYAFRQAGIHPSSFNPFALARRFSWKKRYNKNPLDDLQTPEEVVAVLLLAMAKCEGEVTLEHKNQILHCLMEEM